MACKFCFQIRGVLRHAVSRVTNRKFDYRYLSEFRARFGIEDEMLYVKRNGREYLAKAVKLDPSVTAKLSPTHNQIALLQNTFGGFTFITEADAIVNLTNGHIFKSRHTSTENFEQFFSYYIGSFDKLEKLYVEYLRSERRADLS